MDHRGLRPHDVLRLPAGAVLLRRATPLVLEGILIPTGLFYLGMWLGGVWGGIIAALVWSYAALVRRWAKGGVSGLLLLAVVTLSLRALITGLSGSSFVYFAQPLAGEAALGLIFLASLGAGRSLTHRLAQDFLPIEEEGSPIDLRRIFSVITVLWGATFIVLALLSWWMLDHNPTAAYVGYRTVIATGVKGAAVIASVLVFRSGLRRRGIRLAFGEAA